MKITQFLSYIPFKKYLAGLLVSVILVSSTIHVDFFDSAFAGPENYRDIVSIIVDADTYGDQRSNILRYADDIAGYLGGVRTTILVVNKNTSVATIATKNEKLYYEGDGEGGTSALVGTVLIGNIPMPSVAKDGAIFPSLYPYVDFVDKTFVYDTKSGLYQYNSNKNNGSDSVDIWHGVINPAVGRNWDGATDIAKIGQFLNKTHDFYIKSGKFSPSTTPPRVFYYDGQSESKSINTRSLFQYSLNIENSENIAYNRFTKYLLRDVTTNLQIFDAKTTDPDITAIYASLGMSQGSDTLSESQIAKLPDAQSKNVILGFLKNFKEIFNEKSLGEELLSVHNAGRYTSGATVNADIVPISISLMDDIARATLKTSNSALIDGINTSLTSGIASKIIIFDKNVFHSGSNYLPKNGITVALPHTIEHRNYYFGSGANTIQDPSQCTIARGYATDIGKFGRSVLVEANAAFDIGSVQSHIDILKQDTTEMVSFHNNATYSCFDPNSGVAKLGSYWGDNSILKIAGANNGSSPDGFLFDPSPATTFKGFSSPIYSLGGMKESSRIDNPSIANCINPKYQYVLTQPHTINYTSYNSYSQYSVVFPSEWNHAFNGFLNVTNPRFTCNTTHEITAPIDLATSIGEYVSRSCFSGSIYLNGSVIKTANRLCGIYVTNNNTTTYNPNDPFNSINNSTCDPNDPQNYQTNGSYCKDVTIYEDRYYHTIPSIWSHVSPTDDEIALAKSNGITPSLPIDQIRFVEFLTPKGNIARLNYPNFFELQGNNIASVRSWLSALSLSQWQNILNSENNTQLSASRSSINQVVVPGALPTAAIDWNKYVSDAMIEKMLQAKNWLNPDISVKYKRAIESMLSYSHENLSVTPFVSTAPKIPILSDEYEIAYLGLPSSFGGDFSHGSSSIAQASYDTRIREIEAANISDESQSSYDGHNNPAADCGPPDGVPLLEWPAAIICWINAQLPPRIVAGSCGPSTIGLPSPHVTPSQSPSLLISTNTTALTSFYAGSRVVPHLPRSSMQLNDSITLDLDLQKNGQLLNVLPSTEAHLEMIRGTSGGKEIPLINLGKYLSISPSNTIVGETGARFLLGSLGNEATITLKAYYTIPLPDGSEYRIDSSEFQVRVTPEFYSLSLEQSGSVLSDIDVTSTNPAHITIKKILKDGTIGSANTPIRINIFDDVSEKLVYSGSFSTSTGYTLPTDITKKIGVYRAIVYDNVDVSGEITFVVRSGVFSQVRIVPLSSALIRGNTTLATIRLLDRLSNPISPALHSLDIKVSGGYIVDINGDKKTGIQMDSIEAQMPILIGSDSPGKLSLEVTVDGTIKDNKDLIIFNSARIAVMRSSNPQVGGQSIPVYIEIQDENNKPITGLSSVVSWKLPDGAGSFSKEVINITDGRSENFDYIPGTVSGNHSLSLDVPGVGSLSDIVFSLFPGDPLYISHIKDNNSIIFSLRDRYDNISSFSSLVGTISQNNGPSQSIQFSAGKYQIPLVGGQYILSVPGIKSNSITYTDDAGPHTILGMDTYRVLISANSEKIDFAPDYNARYTVLAGGSFLREGEDILYNTTSGQSQSLAVSTVLDNPILESTLFSISPGGAYSINGSVYDATLESSISLSDSSPLLTISDLVTHKQVARVLYRMDRAQLEICQEGSYNSCDTRKNTPTIRLITPKNSNFVMANMDGSLQLNSSFENILSIQNDGTMRMISGISLLPKDTGKLGLEMGVMLNGSEIAKLIYMMDSSLSVERAPQIITQSPKNTPVILSSGFSIQKTSSSSLYSGAAGYKVFRISASEELDENKNGPNYIDSLGALSQKSGIGWAGNNTMLLAYAAGDTVGESTKFFHTYTLVNLGDPVTHIDHNRPGTEIDGIDRTVGSIIARSTQSAIADVFHRDMDHDNITDLIILYEDGRIELFLNRKGKFRSKGIIAYNRDFDSKKVAFGDFTHDGYGDIVGVNSSGSLVLVDNTNRKFSRLDLSLDDPIAQFPTHISQFRIYDMDNDSHDDIIYITAGGELGILYGTLVSGKFTKKILDPTLGITLSDDPITTGGAIKASNTPNITLPVKTTYDNTYENGIYTPTISQSALVNGALPNTATTPDESVLNAEVFYQYSSPIVIPSTSVNSTALATAFADIQSGNTGNNIDTFVRSQYTPAYGLDIEKTYTNVSHPVLYPDDLIRVHITIKNTTTSTIRNIEYLDTVPRIFSLEKTQKYDVTIANAKVTRNFEAIGDNEFDVYFVGGDLAPGATMEISYDLVALPASYGEMVVGDLEQGTPGSDLYGDVGFKTSTTCGASMLLWTSGPTSREYTRGTHNFGDVDFPDGLASRLTDSDNNGVPDSIENMSLTDRQQAYTDMTLAKAPQTHSLMRATQNGNEFNLGFDPQATNTIINTTQDLLDGLSCGFGGGGCMNFPLNWAPLAPGSSPSILGFPVMPNLMSPSAGVPIFSALTGRQTMCGKVPCCLPIVHPISQSAYTPGPFCGPSSAGGIFGTWSPTNFIRIYVTPTLTLGMGTAICMGGPASAMGNIPPPGLAPLIQGGNCIVAARLMPFCKGDGSEADGDVTGISGLGTVGGDTWNATSCNPTANITTETENKALTTDIVKYLKNPNSARLNDMYSRISKRGSRPGSFGPLLQIGSASSGGTEIGIEIDSNTKVSDIGSVIKLKNKRIAAFPDFLMDWLTRQTDEIMGSLFTPPNLIIRPPTSFGQNAQVDSSYQKFTEDLGAAYSQATVDNIKQGMNATFDKKVTTTGVPDSLKNTTQNVKGTLNSIKTAYTMIGKLPFISIKPTTIPLNIPWINARELDKYKRTLDGYVEEVKNAGNRLCIADTSPACLDKKAKLNSGAFISSVRENLKRIEEYKRFPNKIQRYITWKERYIAQTLCNINSIQQITSGWLQDNGIRFRKWAELFVLIKAIAEGWQPFLDIFSDMSKKCGVCHNERNNLDYWILKLISVIVPSIPVITFPKWPDIILDLSDIRLGISISMPNFDPRISPIRLPNLPSFTIGDASAALALPALSIIPPIPSLPDLPDLPSLPKVKLPDLPPPPKIPKLAGSLAGFLNIMKLISKMYCYMQNTFLVPEWEAGDVIAKRTERQGTMPFDFINLNLPQISLPSIKEIKVSSHVNHNLKSDFITEYSRSAVKPINAFQTDLAIGIPKKIGEDVNIQNVKINLNKKLPYNFDRDIRTASGIFAGIINDIKKDEDIFLEIDDFIAHITGEFDKPEFLGHALSLQKELKNAQIESEKVQNELIANNDKKFNLLKEYVSSESDNVAHLQNVVDLLNKEITSENPRLLIADNTIVSSHSLDLLSTFNTYQKRSSYESYIPDSNQNSGLQSARLALESKLSRVVAANTASTSTSSSPGVTEGYSPRYQGVYIHTPITHKQTQLFDYIAPLRDDTRVDTLDIDGDGDTDYIYILDGTLYVKYSWLNVPNKIQDLTRIISTITTNDPIPFVPDYFHENTSTPKNLNFTFVPAYPNEREWRAEFYDRYIEWDHVDIGTHDPATAPKTTIDMFRQIPKTPIQTDTGILSTPVPRSLLSVRDRSSFAIQGRSIDIYTGALSISISPGRVLYTGVNRVTITYTNQKNIGSKTLILEPHTGYEFSDITEITTTGGKLYLIGQEDDSRYVYSDDLIGIPILPGMQIYASDQGARIQDHTHNMIISILGGATYIAYNVGDQANQYEISLPYPNGYYYARMENLTPNKTDRAGVILFSPQVSSDDGAPLIDLPTRIRLPIYSTKSYKISDILTDLSNATLAIDSDLTIDTNGNGIPDDDFGTNSSKFTLTPFDLVLGKFTTPGIYNMSLKATDDMGNTTVMPLQIEAYVLIPQIQIVTPTGNILGSINEVLNTIPVHFFRIRSGEVPVLLDQNATNTDILGKFTTSSFFKTPEIIKLNGNTKTGTITNHGVFTIPTGYSIDVESATTSNPMEFLMKNGSGSISHIHTILLPDNVFFVDISKNTTPITNGILIDPTPSSALVVPANTNDPSIPGGVYITDVNHRPLVSIARDGNIYVLDSTVSLRYTSKNGYILIEVIQGNTLLTLIEYRIDFFYTVK